MRLGKNRAMSTMSDDVDSITRSRCVKNPPRERGRGGGERISILNRNIVPSREAFALVCACRLPLSLPLKILLYIRIARVNARGNARE